MNLLKQIESMIENQKNKLIAIGSSKVFPFTEEDLLQPFDFPAVFSDPDFLYEEGIYHGQLEVYTLIKRLLVELPSCFEIDNHTLLASFEPPKES
jgi:hypothetical protein